MTHSYKIIVFFKYSTEDHITKSKLEAMKKKVAEIISLVLTAILIAPIQKKMFSMYCPFFLKTGKICNKCSVIF